MSIAMRVAASFVLIAAMLGASAGAVDLQPGQWEISTKRERDGVVAERPTRTLCITADKAKDVAEQVGKALPTELFTTRSTTCKIVDRVTTADEVTWHMQCTGLFPVEQTGRYFVDNPQHVTSTVRSSVSVSGGRKTLSSTLTTEARRVGECPK